MTRVIFDRAAGKADLGSGNNSLRDAFGAIAEALLEICGQQQIGSTDDVAAMLKNLLSAGLPFRKTKTEGHAGAGGG